MSRVINVRHVWVRRVVDYGNSCSDSNSVVSVANRALCGVGFTINDERVTDVIVVFFAEFLRDGSLRRSGPSRQAVKPREMNDVRGKREHASTTNNERYDEQLTSQ